VCTSESVAVSEPFGEFGARSRGSVPGGQEKAGGSEAGDSDPAAAPETGMLSNSASSDAILTAPRDRPVGTAT